MGTQDQPDRAAAYLRPLNIATFPFGAAGWYLAAVRALPYYAMAGLLAGTPLLVAVIIIASPTARPPAWPVWLAGCLLVWMGAGRGIVLGLCGCTWDQFRRLWFRGCLYGWQLLVAAVATVVLALLAVVLHAAINPPA